MALRVDMEVENLAHECVHTGQYERHGQIAGFLRAYFTECIELG